MKRSRILRRPHNKPLARAFLADYLALREVLGEHTVLASNALGKKYKFRRGVARYWIHAIETGTFDVERRTQGRIVYRAPRLPAAK